jgi:protease-4
MGNVAGSGGYYVACASDLIFADRSTLTASIGVVGGKFATEALFDKLGIEFHPYKRGKNAGLLASGQPFTPDERAKLQSWMDEIYATFRGHVTAIRAGRLKKPLDELAGGRVFTGAQALELGLIDRIGTLDDAIVHVAGQAGLSEYDVRVVPRAKNFLEVLMEQSGDHEADRKGLDVAAGPPLLPAAGSRPLFELAAPYLRMLDPARVALVRQALVRLELLQREGVVLMMPEMMMGR